MLNDASKVNRNRATGGRRACSVGPGTPMYGNLRGVGGGVRNDQATLTMRDSSSIRGNYAKCGGGGLWSEAGTLTGVRCDPGLTPKPNPYNVFRNRPDNCRVFGGTGGGTYP